MLTLDCVDIVKARIHLTQAVEISLLCNLPVQAANQCDAKRLAALDGKLRLLAAEVDRLDGQAATAAQAQVGTCLPAAHLG